MCVQITLIYKKVKSFNIFFKQNKTDLFDNEYGFSYLIKRFKD